MCEKTRSSIKRTRAYTRTQSMNRMAAEEAKKLAQDTTASLWEVVFCVPTQQKIALFKQRKRFSEYKHAFVFLKMHEHVPPQGTYLALFQGTLAEVADQPGVMTYEELIDVIDDYDGKLAHECEWIVMRYNITTKKITPLVEDEEFAFADKTKAMLCARFIAHHCRMLPDDEYRVITTDRKSTNIFMQKPPPTPLEAAALEKTK